MSDYLEISEMPTSISTAEMKAHIAGGAKGVHESVLRSYHILTRVKDLLGKRVHPEVIEDLIEIMEARSATKCAIGQNGDLGDEQ